MQDGTALSPVWREAIANLKPLPRDTDRLTNLPWQALCQLAEAWQKGINTMKSLLWIGIGLVAVFWTVLIAVSASLANWLAGSADKAAGKLEAIAQWPAPAWLSLWLDPALLQPIKDMTVWGMNLLITATPWLTPLLGWVAPLLWVVWAVVMLILVALAVGGHLLVGKLRPAGRVRA